MFIPLGTDRLPQKRIIGTPILIGLNMAVFLGILILNRFQMASLSETIQFGAISRSDFHWWGLITSQFIHDPNGLAHLGFNMLFLWVFGQAVESRLGVGWFLTFYLMGGIFSGLAHMLASPMPAIGASGAVAAISGAYLILFPRSTVKVLLFFFLIGIYHVPALWFIGFYIAIDLFNQLSQFTGAGGGKVAYGAHLGGYLFGATVATVLIVFKILPRTEMDMVYLFKQSRRRKAMRESVQQQSNIWTTPEERKHTSTSSLLSEDTPSDPHAEDRRIIIGHLRDREGDEAIRHYRTLDSNGVSITLPDEHQVDLANRLLAADEPELAAHAYEKILKTRKERGRGANSGTRSDEIRLLLASIFIRRLQSPEKAIPILDEMSGSAGSDLIALREQLREEARL